jgi:glycosyltransferase involved in cell wall biosynthesis
MATVNRCDEVDSFIKGLLLQTYNDFELLIIDQNNDNRVYDIYKKYCDTITIKYFRNKKKGISNSRNIGLENYDGDIVAFPDDDCEYSGDTLEKVFLFFNTNNKYNFFTCNTIDKKLKKTDYHGKKHDGDVSLFNFRKTGISFSIFIRSACLQGFKFDEQLGVGAEYGSAEESDLLLYLLKRKNKGFYHANIFIYHPYKSPSIERAYNYGKGLGALYKKAIFYYHLKTQSFAFFFVLLKNIIALCISSEKKVKINTLKGRLYGFTHYKPDSVLLSQNSMNY